MTSKAVSKVNDIASITSVASVDVPITHPGTGREMGLRIYIRSLNDPAVKPITRRIEDARLKLERSRKGGFNSEQIAANAVDIICACVTGWDWYDDADGNPGNFDGEQLPFTPVNTRKLVEIDWLRNQIDIELGDEKRFFTN